MKILLITDGIPPETLGGAGRIVMETAEGLHARGHEVTILTTGGNARTERGVAIRTMPKRAKRWAHYRSVFSASRAGEILRVIDEVQPDVIHGHVLAWQCGYRWIAGATQRGIPTFVTAHDVSHIAFGKITGLEQALWMHDLRRFRWEWNPLRNLLVKHALNLCAGVLCVSDALRDVMVSRGIRNCRTLHNGISLDGWKLEVSREEARSLFGIPRDVFTGLIAGRLGWDKGTQLIAKTLPEGAHMIVAGEGGLDAFAALKERNHVFVRQSREQMALLYRACNVVLTPSLCFDCFPTVNLEAMAAERAVIATTRGGSRESVADGETGWIIDPLDEEGWKSRMAWCAMHSEETDACGRHGRERAERELGVQTYLDALERIYGERKACVGGGNERSR